MHLLSQNLDHDLKELLVNLSSLPDDLQPLGSALGNCVNQLEDEVLLKTQLLDAANDSIVLYDLQGNFIYMNAAGCELLSCSKDALPEVALLENTGRTAFEFEHCQNDGSKLTMEVNARTIRVKDTTLVLSIARDITKRKEAELALQKTNEALEARVEARTAELLTSNLSLQQEVAERKKTEQALRESENRLSSILECIPSGIVVINADNHIITGVNQAALDLIGVAKDNLIGSNCRQFVCPLCDGRCPVVDLHQQIQHTESTIKTAKGAIKTVIKSVVPLILGNTRLLLESFIDISEQKQMEEQLRYLSLHDAMTDLYNRGYFEEELSRLSRRPPDPVGLIMCDVDDLKVVNDTMGHENGDLLLQKTATLLKSCFRDGDMVARIGGDEFAILLPNSDRRTVEVARQRILNAVTDYNAGKPELLLSISVGFSTTEDVSTGIKDIFKYADDNMYQEKILHKQSVRSSVVQTLLKALESRDIATAGHAKRLQDLVANLGSELQLPEHRIADLKILAQFHDIGKVGVPDQILFKPGPLSPTETSELRKHSEIGYQIAISATVLYDLSDLILKHHECWDGTGYPLGLKGDQIPIECRILAITDAYNAMTSDLPFKKALSQQEATAELKNAPELNSIPYLLPIF